MKYPRAVRRTLIAALAFAASSAQAQTQSATRLVATADSAFASGNVGLADSLYYIAVRHRPRDPIAREALGRYLGAQGRAKVAIVLLEEARMFGGDPTVIARQLAPLYEYLGEWRALLTLSGLPQSSAERRRVAWLSEHPFAAVSDAGAASIIGTPRGDTIARVAMRFAGRAGVANIVGTDVGFMVGARVAGGDVRRFDSDSATIALDSVTMGGVKFVNVPATLNSIMPGTTAVGVASLARLVVTIDYMRNRIAFTRADAGPVAARYLLVRNSGQLKVLDRGRWVPLGDLAGAVAKASKTMVIDVAAGEVRIR